MPSLRSLAMAALLGCTCLGALSSTGRAASEAEVSPVSLLSAMKDQFDRPFAPDVCAGKVVLVIHADRKGSNFSGRWAEAIGRELQAGTVAEPVQWVSVASLPAVPRFMHGFVKGKFPQDRSQSTFLDWDGKLAKACALPSDRCNVLILGRDGRLLHEAGGREVDAAVVTSIVRAIQEAAAIPEAPPG